MDAVNMHEAKSRLSQLVEAVESGREAEVVIARNGRPVARLVPLAAAPDVSKRIGVAKGKFTVPDDLDEYEDEITAMFENGGRL
jgi:prevent-host-death family protein